MNSNGSKLSLTDHIFSRTELSEASKLWLVSQNTIVSLHWPNAWFQRFFKSFSLIPLIYSKTNSESLSLYKQVKMLNAYRVTRLELLSLDFKVLNRYSTGFNQGEYSQLNKMVTPNLLTKSKTIGCLWIAALSMNSTIYFFRYFGFASTALRVWNKKFSNNEASTPPSIS